MLRDAYADSLLFGMPQLFWHFAGGWQNEGVAARSRGLDQSKNRIANLHVLSELGKLLAHQRKMVLVVELADISHPLDPVAVANLAAQRIAGISRVDDQPTTTHDIHDLADQPRLRVIWMDVKVLRHMLQ